ncbi:RNA/RNP complex-1-interacting phosphatase homolog [Plutella xylostella]|uniref:RNA/RNP complex-1-interacting phosphatase homolog n=1 Tax=Plutella xylostella TaxID=51655 RepID=UPI0020327A87|nr:RNA/RNP complex-1-interacting phosphatase homolog [Plutella xylostella]
MARSIPDRWIPYKACGSIIEGTRMICFKVPLKRSVQVGKPEITEIWDIPSLIEAIPGLGAVIDLTNTARYYDPKELEAAGVLHKKILMPGREIPPENKVTEFMDAVDEFLGVRSDLIVGVHCTHGLNRTGYMVCRYLRDRVNIPAKDAIERFEKARGYHIERKNYLADLLGEPPHSPDKGRHTEVQPVQQPSRRGRQQSEQDSFSTEFANFRPRNGLSGHHSRQARSDTASRLQNYNYDYKYDY